MGEQTEHEVWRLLDLSDPDPYLNMAYEEAVVRAVGAGQVPPTLRLWQNDNAVIIGRHQDALAEVNEEACRALGTAVVRRMSGGGAVYHDAGNLNYAIAVPLTHPFAQLEVLESYRLFCTAVVEALAEFGLQGEFRPINDIDVDGRKVSGTAQARHDGALLHHGTLLMKLDVDKMAQVLRPSKEYLERKGVASVKRRVATMAQLGVPCTIQQAKEALARGVEKALGVRLVPGELTPGERELAPRLLREKYANDEWNLGGPSEERDREAKGHLG